MIYLESFHNLFPAFEKEEICKIFTQHHYGKVEKIWLTPGLLLTSTENDQVLHPVCSYPATSSSSSIHWSLHVQTQSTVLDMLVNADPFNASLAMVIYVVETSGHIQCWQQCSTTYMWNMAYTLRLTDAKVNVLTTLLTSQNLHQSTPTPTPIPPSSSLSSESESITITTATTTTTRRVTSVCLLPQHHLLFWCEQHASTAPGPAASRQNHTIYKLQLPRSSDGDISYSRPAIERHIVLQNCPPCSLYSLSCSILIVPDEMIHRGVPVGIVYTPMQSSCVLYFGNTALSHSISIKAAEPLNFKNILLQYQDVVQKSFSQCLPGVGCVFQPVKQEFHIILQKGLLLTWQEYASENGQVAPKELSNFSDVSFDTKWTVSQNWLFATNQLDTKVWNLTTGVFLQKIQHPEEELLGVFMSMNNLQLSGLFTNESIYLWQLEPPPLATKGCHPTNTHYRSQVLNVALLDQEKYHKDSLTSQRKLKQLQNSWSEDKHQKAPTDYTRLTDPFLESYWLLEDFWQSTIVSPEKAINPFPSSGSLEDMVHQLLNPSSNIPGDTRQVQLMILSHQYPALILTTLNTFLDFYSEVCEKNLPVWQFILGLDKNTDLASSTMNGHIFEVLCQVIYKQEPHNLVLFVMKAQQAYELNIGIAAFTRDRHTKRVYCEAYSCLPDPAVSLDPYQAVEAKVQLILKSESGHYFLRCQDVLLTAGHWDSAMTQLRQSITDRLTFRQLLHVTLKAMAKAQVLHTYMKELSSLLTVNSHISLFELIEELVHTTDSGRYLQERILGSSSCPLYKECPDIQYKCVQVALASLSSLDLNADINPDFDAEHEQDPMDPEELLVFNNSNLDTGLEGDMLSPSITLHGY
ncbi:uncharacterized protein LOC115226573 [Argonauta hians]